MADWLAQQNAGQMIGLFAVVGGILIAVVAVTSTAWVRVRRADFLNQQAESELALKQQMIERGMSADEVERVLSAGQGKRARKGAAAEDSVV